MTELEVMKRLVEETGAKEVDFISPIYSHLFSPVEKEIKEKKSKNCKDCNKLIINVKDLKYFIKYENCENCFLKGNK